MPPKIEEVPEKGPSVAEPVPNSSTEETKSKVTKNPFLAKKKKTVRRDPKDIYSTETLRKGLHRPQYSKGTPLDKVFSELETSIEGTIDEITLETLAQKMSVAETDLFEVRYAVVEKLLQYLIQIKHCSMKEHHADKNLISISLHDMKTFSKLVNIIIIHGVYPALNTFKIGIPLAMRRLNDFSKTKKPVKVVALPQVQGAKSYVERYGYNEKLLTLLYDKLVFVFDGESDVRDLLVKGTGYSDFLTISIALITCPYFHQENKQRYLKEFEELVVQIPGTYELFQTYSLYISSPSPPYFKQFVLKNLQLLHYNAPRKDGLLTLIEFVLGLRENEEINIEKFDNVANVVLAKPATVSTTDYFTNLGNQFYDLLVNINRPYVTSCVGHVLERLWEKNRLVATDFFLKKIWTALDTDGSRANEGVITSEKDFNNVINVLISLTKKGMSTDLTSFTFKPILSTLWAYFVFLKKNSKPNEVALNIIVSYFVALEGSEDTEKDIHGLDTLSRNLVGSLDYEFELGPNKLPQIVVAETSLTASKDKKINDFLSALDASCAAFLDLLKNLDDSYLSQIFKVLLRRWLNVGSDVNRLNVEDENPFTVLVDLRLIESIVNEFKEDIAKTPDDMLEIVDEFLQSNVKSSQAAKSSTVDIVADIDSDDEDSDDEDAPQDVNSEALPVLLELLSAVLVDSTSAELSPHTSTLLKRVVTSLRLLSKQVSDPSVSKNIGAINSLHSRISDILSGGSKPTSEADLHKKTLERAITSLNDPLVPIRAHGLYLLRQLIEGHSEVISLDFVINLHLIQLKDPEPFIYLNVIKGLESLIELDQDQVVEILVNIYVNEDGTHDVDERLKIGEVLLRFIQRSNELFTGHLSEMIAHSTVSMIRRYDDESKNQDVRIRMSSMSLLGASCKTNALGMVNFLTDAIECGLGILQLEKAADQKVMRRAAVVLIHDLIIGTSHTEDLPFPKEYQAKVVDTLKYIVGTDEDLLTREQAQIVLNDIDELTKLGYEAMEDQNKDDPSSKFLI